MFVPSLILRETKENILINIARLRHEEVFHEIPLKQDQDKFEESESAHEPFYF